MERIQPEANDNDNKSLEYHYMSKMTMEALPLLLLIQFEFAFLGGFYREPVVMNVAENILLQRLMRS